MGWANACGPIFFGVESCVKRVTSLRVTWLPVSQSTTVSPWWPSGLFWFSSKLIVARISSSCFRCVDWREKPSVAGRSQVSLCSLLTGDRQTSTLSPVTLRAKFRSQLFSSKKALVCANTCLIQIVRLVVAGCHWPLLAALCGFFWCTRPACVSWTSQRSTSRRSQSIFPSSGLGAAAASSHRWLRRGKGLLSEAPGLGRGLCCTSSSGGRLLGPVREALFGPQARADDQLRTGRSLQWCS